MKEFNVAVIGAAGWIGNVHSECHARVRSFMPGIAVNLHTAVDVVEEPLKRVAERYGYKHWTMDAGQAINDPDIDIVDICCINSFHKEYALRAARAGKAVICEKPLATSYTDGEEMLSTVRELKTKNLLNFIFRKCPAIVYAKQLIDGGAIGDPLFIRIVYEQDFYADPNVPYDWHFEKKTAGAGALYTLGCHTIDLSRFLMGDYKRLCANFNTFVPKRPKRDGTWGVVDVEDCSSVLIDFKNGGSGVMINSWATHGRKVHIEFQVSGTGGTVLFNSERMNELDLYEASGDEKRRGFKNILIGNAHPYWPLFNLKTGMNIGFKELFTIQFADFCNAIVNNTGTSPDFEDGLVNILYGDKIIESAESGRWVDL